MLGKVAAYIAKTICKRLSPSNRAKVVRDSIQMEDLYLNLPSRRVVDLLFGAAMKMNVVGLSFSGKFGVFEGSPRDRAILRAYALQGAWSPSFQTTVVDLVFAQGKGTLLDIGANIGLTVIPAAMKHAIRCIAFEPDPTNFEFLKRNLERNGVADRVSIYNVALHDTSCFAEFELSDTNLGDHRLRLRDSRSAVEPAFNKLACKTIPVQAKPLDEILGTLELERPILMKVDTQGSEATVLRGARRVLQAVDFLIVEFSPHCMARMGIPEEDLFEELRTYPYGAILRFDQQSPPATPNPATSDKIKLYPIDELIKTLGQIACNKSPDNYVDVFLSKRLLE